MKKLLLCLSLILLVGCQKKEMLFLKQESMELELGEILDLTDPRIFLDEVTNEIYHETDIRILKNDQDVSNEQLGVGTYTLRFTYQDEVKEMKIIVQDTTAPSIKPKDRQTFDLNERLDLESLVSITDFSGVAITEIKGTIDTSVVGDYPITYTAVDSCGNSATEEIIFNVVDFKNATQVGY